MYIKLVRLSEPFTELSKVSAVPTPAAASENATSFALPAAVSTTGFLIAISPSATISTVPPPPASPQERALEPSVFKTCPSEPSALGNTHTSLEAIASGDLKPT